MAVLDLGRRADPSGVPPRSCSAEARTELLFREPKLLPDKAPPPVAAVRSELLQTTSGRWSSYFIGSPYMPEHPSRSGPCRRGAGISGEFKGAGRAICLAVLPRLKNPSG